MDAPISTATTTTSAATAGTAAPPSVDFDDVSFGFDDHVVLRRVSFQVPKGSMRFLLGEIGRAHV